MNDQPFLWHLLDEVWSNVKKSSKCPRYSHRPLLVNIFLNQACLTFFCNWVSVQAVGDCVLKPNNATRSGLSNFAKFKAFWDKMTLHFYHSSLHTVCFDEPSLVPSYQVICKIPEKEFIVPILSLPRVCVPLELIKSFANNSLTYLSPRHFSII